MKTMLVALLLIGCATDDQVAGKDAQTPVSEGDPQLPPQGDAALTLWLSEGHYLSWACEDAPHAARPPGAHGTNRICSNATLSASTTGSYPEGAASVKEIYQSGSIAGFAVGRKLADRWYWYEKIGSSIYADGTNKPICDNCHSGAPRDNVFTQVR